MPNGLTEEQMVERMYTAMVGIDGKSGIVQDITEAKESRGKIHERIDGIEKNMVSKTECKAIRKDNISGKRNRWLITKDILLILLGPAGGAGSIILILKLSGGL